MICLKCNEEFPRRMKIDGKIRDFKNRQYCLNCSPLGIHNTRPLITPQLGPKIIEVEPQIEPHLCECQKDEEYYQSLGREKCKICCDYFSPKKLKYQYCITCYYNTCDNYVRYQLALSVGGKCSSCNYDRYYQNLFMYNIKDKKILDPCSYGTFDIGNMINKAIKDHILLCNACILEHKFDNKPAPIPEQ